MHSWWDIATWVFTLKAPLPMMKEMSVCPPPNTLPVSVPDAHFQKAVLPFPCRLLLMLIVQKIVLPSFCVVHINSARENLIQHTHNCCGKARGTVSHAWRI
jgi:hypothetical protein